ncbi:ras guanine nucleotide exchange factor domain-containing protein [Spinellus fusiger]|nr:ras guanine nucleotide exchange factor domain-containing protein [Spinellus fusiger]
MYSEVPKSSNQVRALYSFNSQEQTALTFKKGDLIEVLARLDSGWWDGWCNGVRGWFPSNYVGAIESGLPKSTGVGHSTLETMHLAVGPQAQSTHSHKVYGQRPLSLGWPEPKTQYTTNDSISSMSKTPSIEWSPIQPTFINTLKDTGGYSGSYFNDSTNDSDEELDKTEIRGVHPLSIDTIETARRLSEESSNTKEITPEQIMDQWTKRTNPQGRIYYCNLITQESTWDFDQIDKATGRLTLSEEAKTKADTAREKITYRPLSVFEPQLEDIEDMTWEKIASDIALAIHQLIKASQSAQADRIVPSARAVVESIRLMLYSSHSMEKESIHLQEPVLQELRRGVTASISKLALSAEMISEAVDGLEQFSRVQQDATHVLTAARNFVTTCQKRNVIVEHINPRLKKDDKKVKILPGKEDDPLTYTRHYMGNTESEDMRRQSVDQQTGNLIVQKSKYPLNQDLVVNLKTHANQIYGSTETLSDAAYSLLNHHDKAEEEQREEIDVYKVQSDIVLVFRNLSNQISQYIGILEDIDLTSIDSSHLPSLSGYRIHKQQLYTAIGVLFGNVQAITIPSNDMRPLATRVDASVAFVENVIDDILSDVDAMAEQRKVWLSGGEKMNCTREKESGEAKSSIKERVQSEGSYSSAEYLEEDISKISSGSLMARKDSIITIHSNRFGGSDKTVRKRQFSIRVDDQRSTMTAEAWYLSKDVSDSSIVFSSDGSVKGGTLLALVERLTMHDALDTSYIATFLLTYRSFCKTEEFIESLKNRYCVAAPDGLTPEELEDWTERKQKLIRLRVFNVMKNWLENYYSEEDHSVLERIELFNNTVVRDSSVFAADQLNRLIHKRKDMEAFDDVRKLVPNSKTGPLPIMPKNIACVKLLETDSLEMARQLSIMDFNLYSKIRPTECLNKIWSVGDTQENIAVNVKQSIDYCNRLTCWVTNSILSNDEPKKRAVFIKYWAQVADKCRAMNNYNTCMAILSAFDNSAIGRLKKTWESVSSRTNQVLGHIRKLMGANRNFTEYREMVHSINPPCIPFLGICLQDLTFIEDGNPDYLKSSNVLINFAKRQKTAEVIREIKQFQSPPYTLQVVPIIQEFIKFHLDNNWDVDSLYQKSLLLEPRELTV